MGRQRVAERPSNRSLYPQRLIINLSVGWEPSLAGVDPSTLSPANEVVHRALVRASCAGALIIAAAGNAGLGTDGMMYPARWEAFAAPTPDKCEEFALPAPPGDRPVHPPPGTYAPLVHAVGGVGERDLPLAMSRAGGQPRLTAYALNVVNDDPRDGRTLVLTGSSMGAAAVSGIAAAAWTFDPELTGAEVMAAVHKGGEDITNSPMTETSLCLDMAGCSSIPVKRATLCGAAIVIGGADAIPGCYTTPAFGGVTQLLPTPKPDETLPVVTGPCSGGSCGAIPRGYLSQPWVQPQPVPGCDTCVLRGGTLYAQLSFPSDSVTNVLLTTYVGRTATNQRVALPSGMSRFPSSFEVSTFVGTAVERATLTIVIDDPAAGTYAHVFDVAVR